MLQAILGFVITVLVTALCLMAIARLPLGIEVASFQKALGAGMVFGIVNALVRPILLLLASIPAFVTLGVFWFLINAVTFGLAAWLVEGFRLSRGWVSALAGSLVLTLVNNGLSWLFNHMGIP